MAILLIGVGIILFNLIVLAHEFGHFFWAKKFGVKVNEFAIGMGPKIFKIQKGETLFSLRIFPIGGFCEMEDEDTDSNNPRSFGQKKSWQRFIIISFGAIMNLVLGFLMTMSLLVQSPKFITTTVDCFAENAVSSSCGLKEGDEILKVNGSPVFTYKDLYFDLSSDEKNNFNIQVKRGGEVTEIKDVHFEKVTTNSGKAVNKPDFKLTTLDKNFLTLVRQTWLDTLSTVKIVWASLIGIITGKFAVSNMTGPIGIASVIGEAASTGLQTSIWDAVNNIVSIMAMITINLGIVNLLPLPALDGGRLIFLLFEMITRKKVNPKYEGWIHALGFFLFIALMIYISYSDILRLLGKI